MTDHKVVSREEWQAAREELLQREKDRLSTLAPRRWLSSPVSVWTPAGELGGWWAAPSYSSSQCLPHRRP